MELRGKRAICKHMKRSWVTILNLWEKHNFPMAKLGGIWISDTNEVKVWRIRMLQRR